MKNTIIEELEARIALDQDFSPREVAELLSKTSQRITQLCSEGKFFYFDGDKYNDGAYKTGRFWHIKGAGIIAYLERSNQ